MEKSSPLAQFDNQLLDGLVFCGLVYGLFEEIRQSPNGVRRLRERQRVEKRLLEELFPICRYVQASYRPGKYLSIRWLNGSQPFDAEVESIGAFVENTGWPSSSTLEVTVALHENEHLSRQLLNAGGPVFGLDGIKKVKGKRGKASIVSEPTTYTNRSYIDALKAIVLKTIAAKTAKTYPKSTTLIVDCSLNTVYSREDWEDLITKVRGELPAHEFIEIFVAASAGGYCAFL